MSYNVLASPHIGNSRLLTFGLLTLDNNKKEFNEEANNYEGIINIISGSCNITIEGEDFEKVHYTNVGGRNNIFEGKPEMVYFPINSKIKIYNIKEENLICGIARAQSNETYNPQVVRENDVEIKKSGRDNWQREVYIGIGPDFPAGKLMMGETESPPGNWSGYPSHKHDDSNLSNEANMEEVYFMQFKPTGGYAVGGIYYKFNNTNQIVSDLKMIQHNQVFCVPGGYHFIAPAPGFRLRYIWMFCGDREFGAWNVDPELAWLTNN